MDDSFKVVTDYHQETKHHFHRFARSLGYMDWDTQPNPFRQYNGAPQFPLPIHSADPELPQRGLFYHQTPQKLTLRNLAKMLELSLGLSAWKKYGQSKWALRMNPSSGNLHPTECYIVTPAIDDLPAGVYHYAPFLHALEQRAEIPYSISEALLNNESFALALSSIHWRESWKYGERAFRYSNLDIGHALAALSFAANIMGWSIEIMSDLDHTKGKEILGFHKTIWPDDEEETLDLFCKISLSSKKELMPLSKILDTFQSGKINGTPNQLSSAHEKWDIIAKVHKTISLNSNCKKTILPATNPNNSKRSIYSATEIIRKRRSAQAFDSTKSFMKRKVFESILMQTLPQQCAPFSLGIASTANLLIFVHNVENLAPGLYILLRTPDKKEELIETLHDRYLWDTIDSDMPLFALQYGNIRDIAKKLSCQQDIAGDSSFTIAILSPFSKNLQNNPAQYKELFYEAGMIGQILYLQAEAYNFRGTGIGCYFDDPAHNYVGIKDNSFQIMYHFTVGYPYIDTRLQTLEPYHHIKRDTIKQKE